MNNFTQRSRDRRTVSPLYQKMLMLLLMLVVGVSGAWAQTVISTFSMPTENPSPAFGDAYVLNDQGVVKYYAQGLKDTSGNQVSRVVSGQTYRKLQDNDIEKAHIKLQFTAGTIKVGDVLSITCVHVYGTTAPTGEDANANEVGYEMGESGTVVSDRFTGSPVTLTHTITASEIVDNGDGNEYIRIGRMDWRQSAYGTITVTRSAGYTVTFSGINGGNVTATANGNPINSGDKVANGTQVTFTATPTGDNLRWVWNLDGKTEYSWDPQTITVNKDINVTHEFGNVYVNVYTNNASLGTVNIKHGDQNATTFHVTPYAGGFTLTATATANGKFMGWYKDADHTQKIDGAEATYTVTNPSGTNNYFAYFVEGANTITKPSCGGYYMDQSKLNAGTATLSVNGGKGTVTTGASGGCVIVKFDQAYSFTDLKKYTVGGTNVAANLNNVEFLKNGAGIPNANFYQGCSDKDLTVENKNSVLTSVDEIRFHFKANTTTTIDYIYFEVAHGPRTKPTLAAPTTTEMRIFSDETLQLRITNTAGFWREYTDNTYKTETNAHGVGFQDGEWKWRPSEDVSGLTPGDYYFGIKDGGNCAEYDKPHESDLVKVHVKVIAPIRSIDVKGTKRYYDVYAPAGISGNVGVVISLHGASNDYDNGRVDFNGIAETEKNVEGKRFVVVYPRGLMRQLRGTERGWDSYTENNTEDVDFFKEIVKELKKTYTVDDKRIYLAGFSNGGMMAYKAAHQAGDFFAAFASVGGFPVNESHLFHAGVQPTPFIHIQGEDDAVFPSSDYDVNTIIHNMVYRNGAQFNPWDGSDKGRVQQDGNMISLTDAQGSKDCHSAENGGADYFFYKIKGLGHWYEKDWTGDGKDDIAETMWKFFNKNDKAKNLDKTLKFKVTADNFWSEIQGDKLGFNNVNTGTSVLSYGGHTKTDANKNVYHSLQFKGVVGGTPHFLKLNITTNGATATDYFIIKLIKTGESTPVVIRRYQANAVGGDYNINFDALNGWNEYKLVVERSRADLDVKVNGVEFHSGSAVENEAFFPADLNTVLSGMNPIYQPVYGQSYDAVAKEYLPIATIPVPTEETPAAERTIEDVLAYTKDETTTTLTSIPSTLETVEGKLFINIAKSGKETTAQAAFKNKNAYILGTGYTTDTNKGIALSHNGPAGMPAYIAGSGDFPTKGVVAMKVQGTFNLKFLLYNQAGDTYGPANRNLKVYYTNDQLNGELKEWKNWDFYGTRNETNANGKNPLDIAVRLPHLGQDGTSTIFLTYEGSQTDDMVWLKGIIAHRPNLKVTIGRTDKERYKNGSPIDENDITTCFGDNKPYQWNFGTSSFSAIDPKTGKEAKKINKFDGRTYVTGLGPNGEDLGDHLLVFSDGASENDKASFDGRPSNGRHKGYEDDATDNNEHIEFNHPTKYSGTHASGAVQGGFDVNRRSFTPILSNGLKVNVTGSGWFSIACSAPNGPVKMKVLSSTNGGTSYINLLREFIVSNEEDEDKNEDGYNKETSWHTYRVYLKAHAEKDGDKGFWDGKYQGYDDVYKVDIPELNPEDTQMALYVVFDTIKVYKGKNVVYDDDDDLTSNDDAQLNIHYLQWANEMPADYVFQREEDPALLNSLQTITETREEEIDGETKEVKVPVLYWQAGNPDMWEGKEAKIPNVECVEESYPSAFNSGKNTPEDYIPGQDSGHGTASRALGGEWNVAAVPYTVAHTEASKNQTFNETTVYTPGDEFASPISGSFFRFMPMENQFIDTWIVPEADANIYILDETGSPIPFLNGADTNGANRDKITQEARMRGWIHAATDKDSYEAGGDYITYDGTKAVRITFAALAAKEYFICSTGGKIALARLNASGNAWRASMEEIPLVDGYSLILNDNAVNSGAISNAMTRNALGDGKYARYATKVKFNRTLIPGTWTPLVLPFSLNEEKFKEVFGKEAMCLHFTKVDEKSKVITLTHHYYNMVVAGRPVFVLPDPDMSPSEITNVTLETSSVSPITSGNWSFTGSFDPQTMKKNDLYMTVDSKLKYLTKEASLGPLRSYISSPSGDVFKGYAKAILLNYDEEEENLPNGIEELVAAEFGEDAIVVTKSTKIYDINGRFVANGGDISNLPAGVYIVNGKKYVVK